MSQADKIAERVIDLHKKMKGGASRGNWEERWLEAFHFIIPNKDSVYDWQSAAKGEEKFGKLYDSSPVHYNELLASALHSMLTNPASQWFELTTGDRDIDKIPAVKLYLQTLVLKIHSILNNTNFHSEIHEVYLDFGAPGMSVLLIDPDDMDVVRFKADPIYKYYVKENHKAEIDTVSTELQLTVRQAFQKYGMESFGAKAKEMAKDLEKEIIIIHMLMPRQDAEFGKLNPANMPIASYHVLRDEKMMIKNSGFRKWPLATPRWMKVSGETYARSAGMKALPDIRMLNAMMQTVIRAAQKVVDPPLMVPDDGMLGRVNTKPGGINSYRAGTQDKIFPLETRGNIGIGIEILQDTRDRIKQDFFIDQLQLREGPQMTATEVNQRTEEHLRLLGPILGRLNSELLKPLIARVIDIMNEANLLPADMPEELAERNIEVFFSSSIAKAQRMSEVQRLNNFMIATAEYAAIDPSAIEMVNTERYVRLNAEVQGIPQEILSTPDELQALAEQKQQQAAQEQQQQADLVEADVTQKMAPAAQARG